MKALIILPAFLLIASFYSCDGIFPSQTKSNVPDDHDNNYGGAMHKRVEDASDCEECHGNDLRGKVYNYNGTLIVTSSCYQCHGNIWEERGNKNFPYKNKIR